MIKQAPLLEFKSITVMPGIKAVLSDFFRSIGVILITQNLQDIIPEISRVILMRKGNFYKDGPKAEILASANISRLFKTPVRIRKETGYYYAIERQSD